MACWYCSGCKTEYTDEGEKAPFGCVVGPRSGPVQFEQLGLQPMNFLVLESSLSPEGKEGAGPL